MDVDHFIQRWTGREGGAERANYQMFLSELCDVLGVPRPEPSGAERAHNDYVFERGVRRRDSDEINSTLRIDLYKKGCFILEAKQSRTPKGQKAAPGQLSLLPDTDGTIGRRSADKGWDVLMRNARKQAEQYVFLLDTDQPTPPFVLVCDVGHCIEVFADFSATGRSYSQFPDRQSFRVYMEDLRKDDVRARLAAIWTDPVSLDPTKRSAFVTRGIAKRLADVSKSLEEKHPPEDVAHFLMRCIFTMFAEDVDLLPRGEFTKLLEDRLEKPASFAPMLEALWGSMDSEDPKGRFFAGFGDHVRYFNGNLFKNGRAFPLNREEIGELWAASKSDWTEVDPAIFGTLLEQALDPAERRKLGAHYTPRAYVERLVEVTVMEPLRADWQTAVKKAEDAKESGDAKAAIAVVREFHHQLCATRVLDPACGTGNFLYVALELMKRLEGEVLETLAELGDPEKLGFETVDPHQFLGLELNPRAAAIAELVVWIGYLQQHYRTRSGHPAEPILRAFNNINFGKKEGYDAVLTWDGYPLPKVEEGKEVYPNPRRPAWPEAEFIVGNPPFIGKGKDMRDSLGDNYVEALWQAHTWINDSADFVLYWWDRAAETLVGKGTKTRRFGLVTTNSITQEFSRRVITRRQNATPPVSLVFAVADHPWTKATKDSAAVRIAMTVAAKGRFVGRLSTVVRERATDTDAPEIVTTEATSYIHPDLSIGTDVTTVMPVMSNGGISNTGVIFLGEGFLLTRAEAEVVGVSSNGPPVVKPYLSGRDMNGRNRCLKIIDFDGLSAERARALYPAAYQRVLELVKPERASNREPYRRDNWWLFARPNTELRSSLGGLNRYIATTLTSKHRFFCFVDAAIVPDQTLVCFGLDEANALAVLSSKHHVVWSLRLGGWLGVGNNSRYLKVKCFDPFPFPDPSQALKSRLRDLGEELDATRKHVQAEHPDLTLTGLYNVLEKLRAGAALTPADEDVKTRGLVLILKELHESIDRLTAEAYGWPADLSDEEILERLVALNAERAKEEAAGHVRWLRPDYQIPRFAKGAQAKPGELDLGETAAPLDTGLPKFPTDRLDQAPAIEAALINAGAPMDAAALSRTFAGKAKTREARIAQALATLARYGHIQALPDGRYVARRAA